MGSQAWTPIAAGKAIVPMAGELAVVTANQIRAFGDKLTALGVRQAHFYTDTADAPAANLLAIRML